jgi:hypothetical protein
MARQTARLAAKAFNAKAAKGAKEQESLNAKAAKDAKEIIIRNPHPKFAKSSPSVAFGQHIYSMTAPRKKPDNLSWISPDSPH